MNEQTNQSQVAQLLARIETESFAAQRGLTGLAKVADHETINARAERGATRIMRLVKQGQHAQAIELMNQPGWGVDKGEM